jgi:hypothetical protein
MGSTLKKSHISTYFVFVEEEMPLCLSQFEGVFFLRLKFWARHARISHIFAIDGGGKRKEYASFQHMV